MGRGHGSTRGGGSFSSARQSAINKFTAGGWTEAEAAAIVDRNWSGAKAVAQAKNNTLNPTHQQIADTFNANAVATTPKDLESTYNGFNLKTKEDLKLFRDYLGIK